jgi:Ca-activated chloride channel homolog
MTDLNLVMTPLRAAVLAGTRSTVDVLVRLQAPEQPEGATRSRKPLHLALVIDRSGSMAGQPLHEAKRCARMVVDGLGAEDRVAVIAYDDSVRLISRLVSAADKTTLHHAIDSIDEGGCTNLHGGWLAGAEELAPHARPDVLSRVILLSDGQANRGLRNVDQICSQCAELAAAGVTTSTYGLGHHFNEGLMTAMADAGRGNAYYGQTADDLADPFREELALLDALCARQVELAAEVPAGVSVEVLNRYARTAQGAWRLPDLAYGGEAWALLRLTVDAELTASDGMLALLEVKASWRDLEGEVGEASSRLPALPVMPAAAYAAVAEDDLVRRRVEEVMVAGLQDTAREAARRQDWRAVERTLAKARTLARDNEWMQSVVGELEGLAAQRNSVMFQKEAAYSARRARSRLAAAREVNELQDLDAPSFLRRKTMQGKSEMPKED